VRISLGELDRLLPAHDVVRHGGHAGCQLRCGTKGIKRMKAHVWSTGQA
jgi:hypothetical protein